MVSFSNRESEIWKEILFTVKLCKKCNELKSDDRFEQFRHQCKDCRNARRKEYGTRSGTGLKNYRLRNLYGIDLETYNKMLQEQNGVCKICRGEDNGPWKTFAVDHCHTTGKVRGLLCAKCNKGLGQFNDDTDLMQKAIEYIKASKIDKQS